MHLAGGGVGAQVGAHEDARILHLAKVDGESMVWGALILHPEYRILDTRYKTQDSTIQDMETGVSA